MKKTFSLAAMAAAVALGFTACGSDDDDYVAPKHDVVLPVPTSAKNAVAFDQMVDTNGNPIKSGGKTLKGITFTETGNAVAEIDGDYVVGKYTAKDGIYTLSGSVKGIVKDLTTRATGDADLTIQVEITIDGQTYNFTGDADANRHVIENMSNTALNNICRKWNFKDMSLSLDGDVKMLKVYQSGDLSQLGKDANENGAGLTIDELGKLNKTVLGFEFTRSGKLYLTYKEAGKEVTECASWDSKNFEDFVINNVTNPNKFISNGSKISIIYNANGGCTITFFTNITGSKNYKAELTINLTEAAN